MTSQLLKLDDEGRGNEHGVHPYELVVVYLRIAYTAVLAISVLFRRYQMIVVNARAKVLAQTAAK